MSKAFVIKNKEGGYSFAGDSFSKNLCISSCYETIEQCQKVIDYYDLKDCKVVEIIIAEGDLEQELAEKDKEIEKLKNFMSKWHFENFESFENHYNYLMSLKNREQLMVENEAMKETIANLLGQKKTSSKEIRKQVCDEIKREITNLENIELSSYMTLCDIIDKIEQGEPQ